MLDLLPSVTLVGLGVGFIVGLTGMGGGALMTPLLILLFGVAPTSAVATDLIASVFMKPLGAAVHMRRGTVDKRLVRLLVAGSVPAAFASASAVHLWGARDAVEGTLRPVLGVALLLAAGAMVIKALLKSRRVDGGSDAMAAPVRIAPTVGIGIGGGLIVGATSVGSGSLIMVLLMLLYPTLSGARLVGTDLAQAVPLVFAAALGHLLFGVVDVSLTLSLTLGALPGVFLGARLSSVAPDAWIRPILVAALYTSALEILSVPTIVIVSTAAAGLVTFGWLLAARRADSLSRS